MSVFRIAGCAWVAAAWMSAAPVLADTVVIPNVNENEPGPSNQAFPFNQGNMRYQQVFARDQFGGLTGVVESFAYRVDESAGDPFGPSPVTAQIWFAHTDAEPRFLSDTFDDNMGPDKTLVFDGQLQLQSAGGGAFDIIIDVEDDFIYDGGSNFIMEIKVFGGASTTQFDAAGIGLGEGGTEWTDRLWAVGNPNSPTGSSGGDDGMVTQFTLGGGGCGERAKLKAKCKNGGVTVVGSLSKATPNVQVIFRLDGGDERRGQTNNRGKAKAKWNNQNPGPHTVTVCGLQRDC